MTEHCRKSLFCQWMLWMATMTSMDGELRNRLSHLMVEQGLPDAMWDMVERYCQPLADRLYAAKTDGMQTLGINGAQGSGKSTWATLLALICRHRFGWNVATLSLDDLYLRSEARQKLAREVHPLLATRGVPGTHDVQLGLDTIAALRDAGSSDEILLPRFDKAHDEPFSRSEWQAVHGPIDLLIFEGWCLGAVAQSDAELVEPCNELERQEDVDGIWRHFVNRQLAEVYPPLFDGLDYRVFLKVPYFSAVLGWRSKQEKQLRVRHAGEGGGMNTAELKRFVQFFERLTRHQLGSQPAISDVVFELDHTHSVAVAVYQTHG